MDSQADFEGEPLLDAFPRERPPQVHPEHLSKYALIYVRQSSPGRVPAIAGSRQLRERLLRVRRAASGKKSTRRTRWSGLELTPPMEL